MATKLMRDFRRDTSMNQIKLHLLTLAVIFANYSSATCQTAPQVVTMKNGTQFIGQIATVAEFSAETPNPWNAQPIALVDNGLKRIFFNKDPDRIGNITPVSDDHPLANPTEFKIIQRTHNGGTKGYGNLAIQPFNEFGHRIVQVSNSEGNYTFSQGITRITPLWCEVETLSDVKGSKLRDWTMRIATNTVPPQILRNLLLSKIRDRNNPADYLSIVDFFREAQDYDMALKELVFIGQTFPDMKETIDDQVKAIRQARARRWIRQINERIDAGQPGLAADMVRAFDRSGIAGEILAEMASIQQNLEDRAKRIEQTRKPVIDLVERILANPKEEKLETAQIPMLKQFAKELETELDEENISRLDTFNRFFNDAEMDNLQKLSFALSGWFLGTNNSTENFAVSQSFYPVRDLVNEYITNAKKQRRAEILEELKQFEGSEPKYLAPMIARMLPPKAPDLSKLNYARDPLEFEVEVPAPKAVEGKVMFKYRVQLPPEYNPYRKYPCVIALPGGKNVDRQMSIWCGPYNQKLGIRVGQAMKNGYIVIVVDWKTKGQVEYGYTNREHQTILRAFRQSLQQFSIDTDRVFIAGHGFGADAAYDIGISHPEHWAGVIGISGRVFKYPDLYRDHTHNRLPVYCVVGEKDVVSKKFSQDAWNKWLKSKRFFDCTVVEYRGRSNELFVEEIVEIFKWTAGQRRQLPDRNGFEFTGDLRRPWDNYFWFYELHGFPLDKAVWPEFFGPKFPRPVKIRAELKANQINRFFVTTLGEATTLWLSPEFVDFEKEIKIGVGDFSEFVQPSRQILLDDVRSRCDRQHPYWANLHFRGKWQPNITTEK